jgi:hypothetical protein
VVKQCDGSISQQVSWILWDAARHVGPNGRGNCCLVLDTVRPLRAEFFFFFRGDQDLETDLYGSCCGTGFLHTLPVFTDIKWTTVRKHNLYLWRHRRATCCVGRTVVAFILASENNGMNHLKVPVCFGVFTHVRETPKSVPDRNEINGSVNCLLES